MFCEEDRKQINAVKNNARIVARLREMRQIFRPGYEPGQCRPGEFIEGIMLKGIFLLLSLSPIILIIGTARAATFAVNSNGDTFDAAAGDGICADAIGNCTLRTAVDEANALAGNDVINFDASLTSSTITLTAGVQIVINGVGGTLQINGLGANKLIVDGGPGSNRIFFTVGAANLNISNLTMQNGGAPGIGPDGSAVNASGGTLVLDAVVVQNNNAGANNGGGIYYNGGVNHRILNSTINNNSSANGGGLYLAGGTLFVANSTISGNTITGQGGGALLNGGAATMRNSTVTNNAANSIIGGIQSSGGVIFNIGNTIIAGNIASSFPDIGNFNGTVSVGNNFIGDSPGDSANTITPIAYQPTDIQNQNPMFGILQNNGGPTPTNALNPGSLAINSGDNAKAVDPFDNSALTRDQRGYFPRAIFGNVDIGAFEFGAGPTAASVSISGRVLAATGNALGKAKLSLTNSGGETRFVVTNPFGYYRFDEVAVGETYILSVVSKQYEFTPQMVSVFDELTELDFISQ